MFAGSRVDTKHRVTEARAMDRETDRELGILFDIVQPGINRDRPASHLNLTSFTKFSQ
jgi:hypothetical protein